MNELRIALIVIAAIILLVLLVVGLRHRKAKFQARPYDNQQDFSHTTAPETPADNRREPTITTTAAESVSAANEPTADSYDDPLFAPKAANSIPRTKPVISDTTGDETIVDTNTAPSTKPPSTKPLAVADRIEPGTVEASAAEPSTQPTAQPTTQSVTEPVATTPTVRPDFSGYTGDPMIVQLHVLCKPRKVFAGNDILAAAEALDLRFSRQQIFYAADAQNNALFHVTNRFEPGTFNADDWAGFFTEGLTLFAVLPNTKSTATHSGAEVFDAMVAVAKQLAEQLEGQVVDASQSSISMQSTRYTRDEIVDFERSVLQSITQ